jgi:hypothetical protein
LKNNLKTTAVSKANTRTNLLILGLFFQVWAINGFFIGGNTLKLALLGIGFILIIATVFTLPKNIKFVRFTFIAFVLFLSYMIIAIIMNANTTDKLTVVFDIICFFLLLSGYLIVNNLKYFSKASPKVIILITLLTMLGVFMYLKYQSVLSDSNLNSRSVVESGNDSDINAIGLAYTNSIVFFILYYFLVYYQLKKWALWMVILSMCSTIFLIFSTQSRGALIYITLILLINNFYRLKSMKNIMKFFAYFIVFVLLGTVFYFEVIKSVPSLENKVDGAIGRFSLLSKVGAGNDVKVDQSAYQRTLFIKEFFDDLSNIIFFGQDNYKPYPHNQFLEIIMRWGVFFGMPLLFISISSFFKSVRILIGGEKIEPFINMAVLLFAFAFLQSLSSMSLDVNRILWFGLGFIIGLPSIYRLTRRKVIAR